MKPNNSNDWQKRFDKEFSQKAQSTGTLDLYDFYEFGIYDDIKSFISSELKREREKVLEEVREVLPYISNDEKKLLSKLNNLK